MKRKLSIPPLFSGGIMLSYRCTNACRHCLYRCSPQQPDEWMTLEMAERTFKALQGESRLDSIHIAGGEPALKPDLLVEVVRLAVDMGLPVAYVETNAFFATERQKARDLLERLRGAGLSAILISVSMFHNEFVPFKRSRVCIEEARKVFGEYNVIVYQQHIYNILAELPEEGIHSLEEFCRIVDVSDRMEMIPRLYQVIPGGRAAEALRMCYPLQSAESFRQASCRRDLLSVSHFHIDNNGDLFTGLCAGLAAASIENLHPEITIDANPVFCELCESGPYGLMRMAEEQFDFQQTKDGYVSKCALCLDVRRTLLETEGFPELRPHSFYE